MINLDEYRQFLASKRIKYHATGFKIDATLIHKSLFPFQRDLVRWAIRKGRCALFEDTGLGKTRQQVEWVRLICEMIGNGTGLIIAPLGVVSQTTKESKKIGVTVHYSRTGELVKGAINITNYEHADKFDYSLIDAVVLDESSILKDIAGKTRQFLTDACANVRYKLACTATPAPNDIAEIANHAEWLGIMSRKDMLSTWFVHDATGWRLRKWAEDGPFYRWLASWGMCVRKPSDLGYDDKGYNLPGLEIIPVFVESNYVPEGQLFFTGLKGVSDRTKVRQGTIVGRVAKCAEIVSGIPESFIVWCALNDEQDALEDALGESFVSVRGNQSPEEKVSAFEQFVGLKKRGLLTKPKVAQFGLNFQHCHNMVFVGLGDSWESFYQCVRREYRFGQRRPVKVWIIMADIEDEIYKNVMAKDAEAKHMAEKLVQYVAEYAKEELVNVDKDEITFDYHTEKQSGNRWELMLGDSVERLAELADESIDLSVFSPPFASLYAYSPSERDLGNCSSEFEFFLHFRFVIDELLRVTKPGRIACVHVSDIPAMQVRDGYIGLKDFSGYVVKWFTRRGWILDARVPIDKNQQAQSIRTRAKGLTMTQMEKDRTWSRPALPDYILKFRKPGENPVPVNSGDIDRELWIEYAAPTWPGVSEDQQTGDRCLDSGAMPTWYGIKESDTLQGWQRAKDGKDERHICPLQLETIRRCIKLWSNPNELILDPFAGIGSTGVVAIELDRRFVGCELKASYYRQALKNLGNAHGSQGALWENLDDVAPAVYTQAGMKGQH